MPRHSIASAATAFLEEVERIRASIPRQTGLETTLAFKRLAAMIGDGHTGVDLVEKQPRLPISTFWFEDGLRITAVEKPHQAALGARVTAINGLPIEEVLARLRSYIGQGETEWGYRSAVPYMLGRPDVLSALGAGTGEEWVASFVTEDGRTDTARLRATRDNVERARLGTPLWWRNPGSSFWTERWEDGTVYANWRGYDDLASHGQRLMEQISKSAPERLIIDLRDNSGGDYNIGRAFIAKIAKRPELNRRDKLFVLVGRRTFSAGMTNAVDFLKTTNATLVGEPAGAAPNNWQELGRFHLPHSGLAVGVSTRRYEFLPGASELRPHIYIPPVASDWRNARDLAVEQILRL